MPEIGSIIGGIGAVGSIAGGFAGGGDGGAAAAGMSLAAVQAQIDWQREMLNRTEARQKPFYDVGVSVLPTLQNYANATGLTQSSQLTLANTQAEMDKFFRSRGLYGSGAAAESTRKSVESITAADADKKIAMAMNLANMGQGFAMSPMYQQAGAAGASGIGQAYQGAASAITAGNYLQAQNNPWINASNQLMGAGGTLLRYSQMQSGGGNWNPFGDLSTQDVFDLNL